ncbi:DEAD/DEAH box helicase family protein [Pseudomonadota bacterium]
MKPQKEVETIDLRLAELERERNTLIQRKKQLVRHISTQQNTNQNAPLNLSVNQKIELFKELFKGRSDVFANQWQNSKGRNGYSVACHNEWISGICNKPKIKCNECPNRKYKALNDQVIYDHLDGKQVIGIYPLLSDSTCYLLAIDFDGTDWRDSVKAMAQACLDLYIPYAIEISRSGNGAHLWIFFSEPVAAEDARLLGFSLLDKAMEIHPSLSFDSYDRLFPNQDLMPAGGFGNLIALPLQHQVRQQGNSQFMDLELIPYPDQWQFLSQIKRLSSRKLEELVAQLTPNTRKAMDDRPPWEQGLNIKNAIIGICPKQITLTLANHIYIKIDELPSPLAAMLKRLASFSNPVFFKTQALRFSTHGIPRYISCAHIEQGYLSLPRGCIDEVVRVFEEQNVSIAFDDQRQAGHKLSSLNFVGKLRSDQAKAVKEITKHNTGVLHAPTAFGKTVTAIGIIVQRETNTLILTHTRQLLGQWQERLNSFLTGTAIGIIGGGRNKPTGQIDVATYQSLVDKRDNTVRPLIQEYGQVIIDECHHISAPRYEMLLNEVRAKYVLGLTATPDRQDGHQKIMFMVAGPIRHQVKPTHSDKFDQQVVVTKFYHHPPNQMIDVDRKPRISEVYRWLTDDQERTRKIVADITSKVNQGKHPLVLTERRNHAEQINQLLLENNLQTVLLRGAMRTMERKAAIDQLNDTQVIVATGKYIGEGFDLPRLDTLFLVLPVAWKGLLAQYAGRIHRESDGKKNVTIFDYVDSSLPMLERMFHKREKGYKAMGFQITFADINDTLINKDLLANG